MCSSTNLLVLKRRSVIPDQNMRIFYSRSGSHPLQYQRTPVRPLLLALLDRLYNGLNNKCPLMQKLCLHHLLLSHHRLHQHFRRQECQRPKNHYRNRRWTSCFHPRELQKQLKRHQCPRKQHQYQSHRHWKRKLCPHPARISFARTVPVLPPNFSHIPEMYSCFCTS